MKTLKISFAFLFAAFLVACSTPTVSSDDSDEIERISSDTEKTTSSSSVATKSIYEAVEESGLYTTKDSVAAYLCKFDKLPSNYVGKNEGKSLYESKTGNSFSKWNFNPWTTLGVMIGGDVFENREGRRLLRQEPRNKAPDLPIRLRYLLYRRPLRIIR